MKVFKSKVLQNTGIYGIINLLQKGINFLLVPVLTSYLTTYDYGVVAVVTAINAFLNVFYLLALNGSLNRFYYEYKDDKSKVRELFGTIVTFVFIFSLFLSIVIFLGRNILLVPFLDNIEFYPYMLLGMISVLFNPIFTIFQNTLQARQEGKRYGRNNLAFFITNISLLLIAVILLRLGARGVLGALAITNGIFFLFTIYHFSKELKFGINAGILKESLRYSLPLVPHSVSGVATSIIDRLFVNNLLSTSLAGVYNLGSTFGGIVFILASAMNQAFVPWFNERIKASQMELIPKPAKWVIYFLSIIALGVSFFGKEVIQLVTPEAYHLAWKVIPFIAFGFVYHGIYYFFSMPLFYDISGKGSRTLPLFTISAAVLNILLNLALIDIFGLIGAAISLLLTRFLLTLALSQTYKRFLSIKYESKTMILVPLLLFLLSLVVFIEISFIMALVLKMCLYLGVLYIGFYTHRHEIIKITNDIFYRR